MDRYPYTNFHELNLVYFLKHFKEIFQQWDSLYQEMHEWKDTTTEELETWKSGVIADIESWEATLLGEVGDWEDDLMASLEAWKTAFETLFDSTFSNLENIKTDAEAARDAAIAAQEAAEAAVVEINDIIESLTDLYNYVADYNYTDSSLNGITYDGDSNGVITVSGTATAFSSHNLKGGSSSLIEGLIPGHQYIASYTRLNPSAGSNADFKIYFYDQNQAFTTVSVQQPYSVVTIPIDTVGIRFRIAVPMGATVNDEQLTGFSFREARTNSQIEYDLNAYKVSTDSAITDLTADIVDINNELTALTGDVRDQAKNHFVITKFTTDGYWYHFNNQEEIVEYGSGAIVEKSAPIPIEGGRTYYSAWTPEGPAMSGVWLDKDQNIISPIRVISPYREVNGVSKIDYDKFAICEKNGLYYKANEDIGYTAWDSSKWTQITKPENCAEIVYYDIPQKGATVVHRWTDAFPASTARDVFVYANLYSMTAPDNAAFIVLNLRTLNIPATELYNTTTVQYLSTLPIFAETGLPNIYWRDDDIPHSMFKNKNLCVIGQSGVMVGRLLRHLPNDLTSNYNRPLVGWPEYMIPYFKSVTLYGYSGQNYMKGTGDHEGKSIYDYIVTGQTDLSDYDIFLLTSGTNDIKSDLSNIGDADDPDDVANPETYVGGMNALIDYLYSQTATHAEPPMIFLGTMPFHNSTPRTPAVNAQTRKICQNRHVNLIDLAELAPTNDNIASRYYYDGTLNYVHANNYGNRNRGLIYRRAIVGE